MFRLKQDSIEEAIDAFERTQQRTRIWGIDNQTNERIDIAFGQLLGYDLPDYATNTGVTVLGQNTGPGGDLISDPLAVTGGLPLAAYQYDASVRLGGQVLNIRQTANDGEYIVSAVAILSYRNNVLSTDTDRPVELKVVVRTEKR